MAEMTLGDLAARLGAKVIKGDPGIVISGVSGLSEAGSGDVSFLANAGYKDLLATTKAGVVIVGPGVTESPAALIEAEKPDLAFAKAAEYILPPPPRPLPGIHPTAIIGQDVTLGKDVSIGACSVIADGVHIGDNTILYPQTYIGEESKIGANCLIYPKVTVYHRVTIGSSCIIHAGAVIGSDGFGFAWTGTGYYKIVQAGTVVIEDDVEIGANTTIDRARFGETRIGAGTKLDNLIQIAHNVKIGRLCAFAAQVGIAGSATVGNGVQMGGQAAMVGHITIGDQITVVGQSAISKNVPGAEAGVEKENLVWIDSPAKPMREQLKEWQNIKSLGKLKKTVKALEARLTELEKKNNDG